MGKVYFPRLVMPISAVLTGCLDLLIQLGMLVVIMIGYAISGYQFNIGLTILLAPVLIFQAGILGMGFGIIISSLMECWRHCVIGTGTFLWGYWGISWSITLVVLFAGVLLFSKVEKTFMDTV